MESSTLSRNSLKMFVSVDITIKDGPVVNGLTVDSEFLRYY